jgi:NRPS condensation-like uncharacterized protein
MVCFHFFKFHQYSTKNIARHIAFGNEQVAWRAAVQDASFVVNKTSTIKRICRGSTTSLLNPVAQSVEPKKCEVDAVSAKASRFSQASDYCTVQGFYQRPH